MQPNHSPPSKSPPVVVIRGALRKNADWQKQQIKYSPLSKPKQAPAKVLPRWVTSPEPEYTALRAQLRTALYLEDALKHVGPDFAKQTLMELYARQTITGEVLQVLIRRLALAEA